MADRKHIHVVRHPEGGWANRREGSDRASGRFPTQREAEDAAREIARREGGEVFIHDRGGKIRDRDSYGNDPFPPMDRKH